MPRLGLSQYRKQACPSAFDLGYSAMNTGVKQKSCQVLPILCRRFPAILLSIVDCASKLLTPTLSSLVSIDSDNLIRAFGSQTLL